ncbi:MAG: bifunctional riboflavin kinase/FAD synthetase [Actinobacteria bacterium]|uniref:Bifunctional riboflavin kinase/FMN adenylyltransferase n=1 Tax=freshwater metagenome TaxID=449393 RepID=A0A6J5Z603_9ZZZZ|nr:bifunctional riboflavin kinase/FAD synthetase [Actinomycetota bacterium]
MKVTPLSEATPRPRTVAVGSFDGVHLGHREVIAGADTVLTFDPHPMAVTSPGKEPPLLTTLERKAELLGELGVEEMVVVSFDADFAQRSASQFVDEVLVERLGASHVRIGSNFGFGHRAQGRPETLLADERFETTIVPLFDLAGETVSSSRIRGLIRAGEVADAARLLGSQFVFEGVVEHGEKRGRELGYPTANLSPAAPLCTPGQAVYAGRVRLEDGSTMRAAINVGLRPMFNSGLGELIEAYVLDFEGDLYGQRLSVEFVERLRGEERFDSVESLIEQMASDVEATRAQIEL